MSWLDRVLCRLGMHQTRISTYAHYDRNQPFFVLYVQCGECGANWYELVMKRHTK